MTDGWQPEQTGTHQDHVIAHVVGTTVLGYFTADDAVHLALDIGFIWAIFPDTEMGLLPQSFALRELNLSEAERATLSVDLQLLDDPHRDADMLTRITPAPAGCLIEEVRLLARGEFRRLEIRGDMAGLTVEASPVTGEMSVGQLRASEKSEIRED